jgi:hypothetical protein
MHASCCLMRHWTTTEAPIDEETRRTFHRPSTFEEVKAQAREMINGGLSDYSVAAALAISVEEVRRLVGAPKQ